MTNEQFTDTVRAMHAAMLRSLSEADAETDIRPFGIDLRQVRRDAARQCFAENVGYLIGMLERDEAEAAPQFNDHEWIDLGLPSGLKWAAYNVGANSPEEYGGYYAWGETAAKADYSWATYKHGTAAKQLTKYNTESGGGLVDNLTTLKASDDATHANWGGAWRMPTDEEWTELRDNCEWTWTANYNGTGVAGRTVTGKNGNSIFLPAAGYRSGGDLYDAGDFGNYWSSSLYAKYLNYAWYVDFNSDLVSRYGHRRYYGQSVRPVAAIYTVTVNAAENGTVEADCTTAQIGDEVTLTVAPAEGYELDQLIVKQGETGITVSKGKFTMPAGDVVVNATFKKLEWVDLGLPSGLKWAAYNVGATTPEEYGGYYAWGETAAKADYSWATYKHGTAAKQLTKYNATDGKTALDPEDDAAHTNWGGKWRMPTADEWKELIDNCDWTWTTDYNGQVGFIVTSKANGNSIFLPAAGSCNYSGLNNAGGYGYYWSGSLYAGYQDSAWGMHFYSAHVGRNYYDRCFGYSVRPVRK